MSLPVHVYQFTYNPFISFVLVDMNLVMDNIAV